MCPKRTFHKYKGTQYGQSCNSRIFLKPFSSEYMHTHKYATIMSNLPIISYPEIIPELTAQILRRESVTDNGPQQSIRTSPEVTPVIQESRKVTAIAGRSSQKEYEREHFFVSKRVVRCWNYWTKGTSKPFLRQESERSTDCPNDFVSLRSFFRGLDYWWLYPTL